MSSEVVIRARDLSKAYALFRRPEHRLMQMLSFGRRKLYEDFWAIKNVDLDVYRGETVGIIGCNGSGKSTLLQLICGILTPTYGQLSVDGKVAALLELGAGFNPEFTGRENVFVNAAILGYTQEEVEQRFDGIAAFADIGSFMDQPVKNYSSGMYARLAFATAISVEPDILVVDEALAVGDESFQRKCFARIEAIKNRGGTVLFVSHSPAAVLELCDRAVLLHQGQRLITGEPKNVVGLYQKLIHAPPDRGEEILSEIRNIAADGEDRKHTDAAPPKSLGIARKDGEPSANVDDYFDPDLVSSSSIVYEENGASIENPRMFAVDGRAVNCLLNGRRYRFSYDVRFLESCVGARFFTTLRTISGVDLGGGMHPHPESPGLDMAKGERVTVEFEFVCRLNPDTYFVNCGVGDNEQRSLHRIIDALALRVVVQKRTHAFGIVDFGYAPTITRETEETNRLAPGTVR